MGRLGVVGLLALGASCASAPPIHDERVMAFEAIRTAERRGVSNDARAAQQLRLAKDELNRAEVLRQDGNDDAAYTYLRYARSDAELATALDDEVRTRADTQKLLRQVALLEKEVRP